MTNEKLAHTIQQADMERLEELTWRNKDQIVAALRAVPQPPVTTGAERDHYLRSIKLRLEQLYEWSPNDPAAREQISDEVDWVEAELAVLPAANTAGDVREIATKAIEIANSVRYAAQLMHDGRSSGDPDKLRWLHHGWGADEVRSKLHDWRDTLSIPTPAPAVTGDVRESWPEGCQDASSCARHKSCMYINCLHAGADLREGIVAALSQQAPATDLAKAITAAVLGVMAQGGDNLAIYKAVEAALVTRPHSNTPGEGK